MGNEKKAGVIYIVTNPSFPEYVVGYATDIEKRLFNSISTSKVRYHDVDSYQSLLNIMEKL